MALVVGEGQVLHGREISIMQTCLLFYVSFFLTFLLSAVLVTTHSSRLLRISVLPLTLWAAFHVITGVEIGPEAALGWGELNQTIVVLVAMFTMRVVGWTFDGERYKQLDNPVKRRSSVDIVKQAFALILTPRGIGWNWGKGTYIPAAPTSRSTFLRKQVGNIAIDVVALNLARPAVRFLVPPQNRGSIYDMSLPLVRRHIHASAASLLLASIIHLSMDATHSALGLIGVALLGHDPISWPPLFNSPWSSTSVADFWGRRWHQLFRHTLVSVGGRPLSLLLGKVGYVMGTFFMSAVAHALALWDKEDNDFWLVIVSFSAMGAGILLENLWKDLTGHCVKGTAGRLWMFLWLACWSNILFDVWGRNGLLDQTILPSDLQASQLPHD